MFDHDECTAHCVLCSMSRGQRAPRQTNTTSNQVCIDVIYRVVSPQVCAQRDLAVEDAAHAHVLELDPGAVLHDMA